MKSLNIRVLLTTILISATLAVEIDPNYSFVSFLSQFHKNYDRD